MMKKTSLFLVGAMAMGLVACSSEEPAVKNGSNATEGDFYTTLTLNFGGTRSETTSNPSDDKGASNDGEELGISTENNIDQILIVLCTKDDQGNYSHVTHALADAVRKTNAPTWTPTYVVRFETQDLYDLAGDEEFKANSYTPGETLYVFTYCNPTESMKAQYDMEKTSEGTFDPDAKFTVDGTPAQEILWNDNNFVMTNAGLQSIELPSKYQLLYDYNKETTPFNLGTVTVQRVATRFDLAQKNPETVKVMEDEERWYPGVYKRGAGDYVESVENTYDLPANTYYIMDPVNNVVAGFVTIDAVSFFNEAKDYYAFIHTSPKGTPTDWTLCGVDNKVQYVVSPYYQFTNTLRGMNNFNYSLVDASGNIRGPKDWDYTLYSDIIGKRQDNWGGQHDYYFWKYSTPNTIPADESNQIKGNTTGVLFRAYITPNERRNPELVAAMENGDDIYAFEGKIYGNQEMLVNYVKNHPQSEVQRNYDAIFDEDGNLKENTDHYATTVGKFTVYKPTLVNGKNVYYCYYYYYNRHNDNGNNTVMGPMEFAAVRNNVYKLFVESVKEFGHTGDPNDDEKPEDPEDPDESPQTFFKVQVEVLPWVVRVNDIQF